MSGARPTSLIVRACVPVAASAQSAAIVSLEIDARTAERERNAMRQQLDAVTVSDFTPRQHPHATPTWPLMYVYRSVDAVRVCPTT